MFTNSKNVIREQTHSRTESQSHDEEDREIVGSTIEALGHRNSCSVLSYTSKMYFEPFA